MDRRQVWRAVLGELEISLSQATFETWFRRTALLRVDESTATFVLGVPSGFAKDWVDERYRSLIAQTLAKVVGYSVTLSVEVVSDAELDAHGALAAKGKGAATADTTARVTAPQESVRIVDRDAPARVTNLNARYTFATYVVGAGIVLRTRHHSRFPSDLVVHTTRSSCTAALVSVRRTCCTQLGTR